jgi:hypothetical protein
MKIMTVRSALMKSWRVGRHKSLSRCMAISGDRNTPSLPSGSFESSVAILIWSDQAQSHGDLVRWRCLFEAQRQSDLVALPSG